MGGVTVVGGRPAAAPGATPVPTWLVAVFSTVTAAGWIAVAALGASSDIAATGAAAAAGIAVLVAAVDPPLSRESVPVAGPGLVVVTVAAALPASGRAVWPLVVAVVAVAVHFVATQPGVAAGVGVAGSVVLAFGAALDVGTATIVGAVLVAVAGDAAAARRHAGAVLFPLALVVGLFVWTPTTVTVVVLAVIAVLAAAVSAPLAIGLLALVVVAVAPPAALLLAAAAVLAAALRHPAASALALPGAIAALTAAAARPASLGSVASTAAIAGSAAVLAYPGVLPGLRRRLPPGIRAAAPLGGTVELGGRTGRFPPALVPAAAAAAWLFLAPGTWRWTGVETLGSYTDGALIAAAVAGIAVVVGSMLGLVSLRFDRLDR